MQKQYISWCIILMLIFAYPVAARAALSNVVVGLQNGAGDVIELYGENLELILDARETALYNLNRVFAISIDAAGMWPALKGALQDGYNYALNTTEDVLRAIGYLFGDWITEADLLANNVYESAAAHCYVSEDGKLYIDGDFVDYVDSFIRWLWSADGANLVSYAPTETIPGGTTVDGQAVAVVAPGERIRLGHGVLNGTSFYLTYKNNSSTATFYVFGNSTPNSTGICYFGARSGTITGYNTSDDSSNAWGYGSISGTANWQTAAAARYGADTWVWEIPTGTYLSGRAGDPQTVNGGEVPIGSPDIFEGLSSAVIDLGSYFDITATDTATSGDWTITPKQLVQAVANSIAGNQSEQQITAVDGTGAQTVVAATPTGTELQPVEGTPASGSSSFPTITTPTIDGNWNGVEGFEIDLTGVFPFCIPFDIYKLFQKLAVEPVTPVFEIPVAVLERVGMYETITVDLSPFDDFAASVRTVEKLAILVAVGMMSYKMIFGGD